LIRRRALVVLAAAVVAFVAWSGYRSTAVDGRQRVVGETLGDARLFSIATAIEAGLHQSMR